jgi:hypothetical protein
VDFLASIADLEVSEAMHRFDRTMVRGLRIRIAQRSPPCMHLQTLIGEYRNNLPQMLVAHFLCLERIGKSTIRRRSAQINAIERDGTSQTADVPFAPRSSSSLPLIRRTLTSPRVQRLLKRALCMYLSEVIPCISLQKIRWIHHRASVNISAQKSRKKIAKGFEPLLESLYCGGLLVYHGILEIIVCSNPRDLIS